MLVRERTNLLIDGNCLLRLVDIAYYEIVTVDNEITIPYKLVVDTDNQIAVNS